MIDFSCPHCHKNLKVKPDLAGKRIRCPHCRQAQQVPPNGQGAVTAALPDAGGRVAAHAASAATLPPASSAPGGAEDATLPPPSPAGEGVTCAAPASGSPNGERGEVITAGSAYRLGGEIARGGMGAVVRAVDRDIRREVAVKFLLDQSDEGQRARFLEEARVTGQLEHPNIVPIHQVGVHADGRCFFSMKMVKGRSLADILKEQGKERGAGAYTLVRLLGVFTGICNALGYAHSRQVIHRDLKPANVMVGDFGEVYVMDWGLAKLLGSDAGSTEREPALLGEASRGAPSDATAVRNADGGLTQAGAVMGTPSYMPPEQATGQAVDQRSDIYSLGAILYEILTLTPPVVGSDPLAILMRVAEGDIEPPAKRSPQRARQGWVPPELSAIALKALARAPGDRYQSVEALRRDVELFLEGRSVSAKRDSAWELLAKLVKRNKGVSVATAAAILVLSAVVAVAYHSNYQQRVRAEIARGEAEEAQKEAENNYQAFLRVEEEKREGIKKSAPAFLRAAQLTAAEQQFDDALAQANIALDSDPSLTEGYLLKGQLLFALGRYAKAADPLRDYRKHKPDDAAAGKLLRLAEEPRTESNYLWQVARLFEEQKFFGGMTHLDRKYTESLGPLKDRLPGYRKLIEAGWPGLKLGNELRITREGQLHMAVSFSWGTDEVRDLGPLKGIPINELNLRGLRKLDRHEPLRGMPLTRLDVFDCGGFKTLEPLAGMRLTYLRLRGAGPYPDVKPLKGMPLQMLSLEFSRIRDISPLQGAPLKTLVLLDCHDVQGIAPLKGMKLTHLNLTGAHRVHDLGPLDGMPLEQLNLTAALSVRDFTSLQGLGRLKVLNLTRTAIDDLSVLKDLPLTELTLTSCKQLRTLEPLRGMKHLELLNLNGCTQIKDFAVLPTLPLKQLYLNDCPQLADLNFTQGMKLEELSIEGCRGVRDLSPIAGLELKVVGITPGDFPKERMDTLRRMKSLQKIHALGNAFVPADFWKKYYAGEFK
jgi:serine/threonine protein kinase